MKHSVFRLYAVEVQDDRDLEGKVRVLVEILPGIFLDGLRKSPINLREDSRYTVRDANQEHSSTTLPLHEPIPYQEL
jgi:hypothetical protein